MKDCARASALGLAGLVLLLAAPGRLTAQQPAAPKATLPLWKMQGKSNAVHLLGSIHFFKSEFYPLPKPIEEAYRDAAVVVFESDIRRMNSPELQMSLLSQGMYPPGETLKQHVSPQTYAALQERLKGASGLETALDQFRPWMAAVTLAVLELQKLGFNPEKGIDRHFFGRAESDRKQIVPLETVEFQIGLFTELSREDQELSLKSALEDVGRYQKIFEDIVTAWKTGNAKQLEDLLLEVTTKYPTIYKRFFSDRNRAWVPKIEGLLQGGKNAFVVVGMGHLVGTNSVVDLLRKKGIKVEQQ